MKKKTIIRRILIFTAACFVLLIIALAVLNFNLTEFTVADHEMQVITPTEAFDSVNVQSPDLDVLLSASEDGVCRISIPQSKSFIYETTIENGILNVVKIHTAPWYVTMFDNIGSYKKVRIELPEEDYRALTVQASSGSVVVGSKLRFENVGIRLSSGNLDFRAESGGVNLSASSGSISVNGATATEMAVQTSSGNITLTDTHADNLRTLASSGNTELNRVDCAYLNAKTGSGDCTLTDTVASDHIYAELASGNLSLKSCDAETLDISSTSGNILGSLRTPKRFNVRTASGNVSVPQFDTGGECAIKTASGNVKIYVEEN